MYQIGETEAIKNPNQLLELQPLNCEKPPFKKNHGVERTSPPLAPGVSGSMLRMPARFAWSFDYTPPTPIGSVTLHSSTTTSLTVRENLENWEEGNGTTEQNWAMNWESLEN